MKDYGDLLKSIMPAGKAFALIVFDIGEDLSLKEFNYISSAERESMIQAFRQLLTKWENQKAEHN